MFVTVPKFVVAPFGVFTLIEIDETVWLVRAVSVICVFFAIGVSKVAIVIMSNLDAITAVWSDGLFVETISGNLQIDEVKAIVDSIGG